MRVDVVDEFILLSAQVDLDIPAHLCTGQERGFHACEKLHERHAEAALGVTAACNRRFLAVDRRCSWVENLGDWNGWAQLGGTLRGCGLCRLVFWRGSCLNDSAFVVTPRVTCIARGMVGHDDVTLVVARACIALLATLATMKRTAILYALPTLRDLNLLEA